MTNNIIEIGELTSDEKNNYIQRDTRPWNKKKRSYFYCVINILLTFIIVRGLVIFLMIRNLNQKNIFIENITYTTDDPTKFTLCASMSKFKSPFHLKFSNNRVVGKVLDKQGVYSNLIDFKIPDLEISKKEVFSLDTDVIVKNINLGSVLKIKDIRAIVFKFSSDFYLRFCFINFKIKLCKEISFQLNDNTSSNADFSFKQVELEEYDQTVGIKLFTDFTSIDFPKYLNLHIESISLHISGDLIGSLTIKDFILKNSNLLSSPFFLINIPKNETNTIIKLLRKVIYRKNIRFCINKATVDKECEQIKLFDFERLVLIKLNENNIKEDKKTIIFDLTTKTQYKFEKPLVIFEDLLTETGSNDFCLSVYKPYIPCCNNKTRFNIKNFDIVANLIKDSIPILTINITTVDSIEYLKFVFHTEIIDIQQIILFFRNNGDFLTLNFLGNSNYKFFFDLVIIYLRRDSFSFKIHGEYMTFKYSTNSCDTSSIIFDSQVLSNSKTVLVTCDWSKRYNEYTLFNFFLVHIPRVSLKLKNNDIEVNVKTLDSSICYVQNKGFYGDFGIVIAINSSDNIAKNIIARNYSIDRTLELIAFGCSTNITIGGSTNRETNDQIIHYENINISYSDLLNFSNHHIDVIITGLDENDLITKPDFMINFKIPANLVDFDICDVKSFLSDKNSNISLKDDLNFRIGYSNGKIYVLSDVAIKLNVSLKNETILSSIIYNDYFLVYGKSQASRLLYFFGKCFFSAAKETQKRIQLEENLSLDLKLGGSYESSDQQSYCGTFVIGIPGIILSNSRRIHIDFPKTKFSCTDCDNIETFSLEITLNSSGSNHYLSFKFLITHKIFQNNLNECKLIVGNAIYSNNNVATSTVLSFIKGFFIRRFDNPDPETHSFLSVYYDKIVENTEKSCLEINAVFVFDSKSVNRFFEVVIKNIMMAFPIDYSLNSVVFTFAIDTIRIFEVNIKNKHDQKSYFQTDVTILKSSTAFRMTEGQDNGLYHSFITNDVIENSNDLSYVDKNVFEKPHTFVMPAKATLKLPECDVIEIRSIEMIMVCSNFFAKIFKESDDGEVLIVVDQETKEICFKIPFNLKLLPTDGVRYQIYYGDALIIDESIVPKQTDDGYYHLTFTRVEMGIIKAFKDLLKLKVDNYELRLICHNKTIKSVFFKPCVSAVESLFDSNFYKLSGNTLNSLVNHFNSNHSNSNGKNIKRVIKRFLSRVFGLLD